MDEEGFSRNASGQFSGGVGGYDTTSQYAAGVNEYDTFSTAESKVQAHQFQESFNRQQNERNHQLAMDNIRNGVYVGGRVVNEPLSFKWLENLFLFIWNIIRFFIWDFPFGHFPKALLTFLFVAFSFYLMGDFNNMMNRYEWSLEPSNIAFKPSEYYDVDAKQLAKYRKATDEQLFQIHSQRLLDRMNNDNKLAYYAVMKEKMLADPENAFKSIVPMGEPETGTKAWNDAYERKAFNGRACMYANDWFRSYNHKGFNRESPQMAQLALEAGFWNYSDYCKKDWYYPANQFIEETRFYKDNEIVKPYYDKINNDIGYQFIANRAVIAGVLYILSFILIVTAFVQTTIDRNKKLAEIAEAKAKEVKEKAEAETKEKEEKKLAAETKKKAEEEAERQRLEKEEADAKEVLNNMSKEELIAMTMALKKK